MPLVSEVLRFDGLQGKECLSQLFDFQLLLESEERWLSAQVMPGQPVTVDFGLDGGARRHLNGQRVQFRLAAESDPARRLVYFPAAFDDRHRQAGAGDVTSRDIVPRRPGAALAA